jgi:hypothetical protein
MRKLIIELQYYKSSFALQVDGARKSSESSPEKGHLPQKYPDEGMASLAIMSNLLTENASPDSTNVNEKGFGIQSLGHLSDSIRPVPI